ncbi:DUF2076 domain-containing protein [Reyranella sp.]|uniref:DUF2076 domain-containing protein n=1 Tax=Reyranella sp. TaxID=1929291 RepID=UPI003BAC9AFC
MQAQERELITGLFGRLQPFDAQPRDPEADALIRDLAARQPSTAYLLVQTVLVQEQALKAAQERIAELEAKAAAPAPGGGFLSSAPKIGPWGSAPSAAAPAPAAAPQPFPTTRSPLQAAVSGGPAGGGFLRSAMATAAGVAGGALLFEGIRGLMGGGAGPWQQASAQPAPLLPDSQGDGQGSDASGGDYQQQAMADDNPLPADFRDDASGYDSADYDSGDGGGSDDWA